MIFSLVNFVAFFVGRFTIQSVLEAFVSPADIDGATETHRSLYDIVTEWIATVGYAYGSFMKTRFHPNPEPKFLTPKLKNEMDWMIRKAKLPAYDAGDVLSLIKWIEASFVSVGILGVKGFVKTSNRKEEARRASNTKKVRAPVRHYGWGHRRPMATSSGRKTCRAQFNLEKHSKMYRMKSSFKYYPDRLRAIKCMSKLVGRMHIFWPAWISAKSAPIAKSGLVTPLLDIVLADMGETKETFMAKYPAASLFMATSVSTFSERKAFTLKSQKQGALNEHQQAILEIVHEKEPEALRVIALILPVEEVFSKIPQGDAIRVYEHSMKWLKLCGMFYREQYFKGVDKCVRRLCRVPPRGSKINVTAVNNVADAWMNLRRFQTISAKYGKITNAPVILKIMQLIADDQFRWGAGKIDPNAHVYKGLTAQKVYPWDAVLAPESFDTRKALTVVLDECKKAKVGVESWIGIAKIRKGEVTVPVDMICGVAVPPMTKECADWLVGMGVFGAHEWEGK